MCVSLRSRTSAERCRRAFGLAVNTPRVLALEDRIFQLISALVKTPSVARPATNLERQPLHDQRGTYAWPRKNIVRHDEEARRAFPSSSLYIGICIVSPSPSVRGVFFFFFFISVSFDRSVVRAVRTSRVTRTRTLAHFSLRRCVLDATRVLRLFSPILRGGGGNIAFTSFAI